MFWKYCHANAVYRHTKFLLSACRREGHGSRLKKSGTDTILNFSRDISLVFAGRWINARVVGNWWEEW